MRMDFADEAAVIAAGAELYAIFCNLYSANPHLVR